MHNKQFYELCKKLEVELGLEQAEEIKAEVPEPSVPLSAFEKMVLKALDEIKALLTK